MSKSLLSDGINDRADIPFKHTPTKFPPSQQRKLFIYWSTGHVHYCSPPLTHTHIFTQHGLWPVSLQSEDSRRKLISETFFSRAQSTNQPDVPDQHAPWVYNGYFIPQQSFESETTKLAIQLTLLMRWPVQQVVLRKLKTEKCCLG